MSETKANYYRNKISDEIEPALTNPRGYEDEHPEQFEPVSDAKGAAAQKAKLPKQEAKSELPKEPAKEPAPAGTGIPPAPPAK